MLFWIIKFYTVFLLTAIWGLTAGHRAPVDFRIGDRLVAAAVERAAGYLWQAERWNSLSPRIAVALSFARRAGIAGPWESVMEKEVDLHAKVALLKRNASLFDLSQHVNALYATCQDPRHFHGVDLVSSLRTQADADKTLDQPFVLLTLCLANQIDRRDLDKLFTMYYNVREDTLGSKALIVMGIVCLSNAQGFDISRMKVLREFTRSAVPLLSSYDVYTKILHVQALHAVLRRQPDVKLLRLQAPDGSFGDALTTYYAIPALLNATLLDLKCSTSNDVEPDAWSVPDWRRIVVYSLWIEKEGDLDGHSMSLPLRGNETFLDLMKRARAKNALFRFLSEGTREGEKVYSVADIPNDVEKAKEWTLYRGREDRVLFRSKNHLARQNPGVDRIYPAPGDHFVFWYERSFKSSDT